MPDDLGSGWGWNTFLLPFLDQQSLHDRINFNRNIEHAENTTAAASSMPVLLCPSDPHSSRVFDVFHSDGATSLGKVAGSNYVGVFGISDIDNCMAAPNSPWAVADRPAGLAAETIAYTAG